MTRYAVETNRASLPSGKKDEEGSEMCSTYRTRVSIIDRQDCGSQIVLTMEQTSDIELADKICAFLNS